MNVDTNQKGSMPEYEGRKVQALRIKELWETDADDGRRLMAPAEDGFGEMPILLDVDFVKEHNPEVGGYFTVAGVGSCGFMSAAAFQRTYTSSRESSW